MTTTNRTTALTLALLLVMGCSDSSAGTDDPVRDDDPVLGSGGGDGEDSSAQDDGDACTWPDDALERAFIRVENHTDSTILIATAGSQSPGVLFDEAGASHRPAGASCLPLCQYISAATCLDPNHWLIEAGASITANWFGHYEVERIREAACGEPSTCIQHLSVSPGWEMHFEAYSESACQSDIVACDESLDDAPCQATIGRTCYLVGDPDNVVSTASFIVEASHPEPAYLVVFD